LMNIGNMNSLQKVAVMLCGLALASSYTLTVIEHAITDKAIVLGPHKDNTGDGLVFANPLFDSTNTTQVGTDQGYCVRTIVGTAYECRWTATITDVGQIAVEGPFYDALNSVLAITGGTGKFRNIQGEMDLVHLNGSFFKFIYHY